GTRHDAGIAHQGQVGGRRPRDGTADGQRPRGLGVVAADDQGAATDAVQLAVGQAQRSGGAEAVGAAEVDGQAGGAVLPRDGAARPGGDGGGVVEAHAVGGERQVAAVEGSADRPGCGNHQGVRTAAASGGGDGDGAPTGGDLRARAADTHAVVAG